jgi:TolA-binding protein/uncharacterized protein (UPF0147 family)
LAAGLSSGARAWAQNTPAGGAQPATITLPAGEKTIPTGPHKAVIEIDGRRLNATINVTAGAGGQERVAGTPSGGEATQPDAAANRAPADTGSSALVILLAALGPALLSGGGLWYYFKRVVPRRELAPYREAHAHLRAGRYDEALPLLTQVESRLPAGERRTARFLVAFAYYQLDNKAEAERWLDALHREDPADAQTAYLLAHLRVEEERYDEAEPVLEVMEKNRQLGTHHARKLLGLVKFRRAMLAMKDKRVDAAAQLFEKVQQLGDYADRIPADLRNRHVALGTQALFDNDLKEARVQFNGLEASAASAPAAERDALRATAQLGLALAAWKEGGADAPAQVEALLVSAAKLLDPAGPLELEWPEAEAERDVFAAVAQLEAAGAGAGGAGDELNRCLRDLHFLRGVAVLRGWAQMDGEAAHAALADRLYAALSKFACAHARDEEFSDVLLVVGLLLFYLQKPGPERSRAIQLLERARKLGMRDPDALEIVNNRQRLERANADAVERYLQVLDSYLTDNTVRREVRQALVERLSKYRRFQDWERRPTLAQAASVEPTLAEVRHRSEVLLVRVNQILAARGQSAETQQLGALSNAIMDGSAELMQRASDIEQKESELLVLTGTQLLREN